MPTTQLPLVPDPFTEDTAGQRVVRCTACRRPLRDAESRALGLGPECQVPEFPARTFEVEQEALPGL